MRIIHDFNEITLTEIEIHIFNEFSIPEWVIVTIGKVLWILSLIWNIKHDAIINLKPNNGGSQQAHDTTLKKIIGIWESWYIIGEIKSSAD